MLDREKQTVSFSKNGRDLGVAYKSLGSKNAQHSIFVVYAVDAAPFRQGNPTLFIFLVDRLSPDMQGIGLKPHICGKVGQILRQKNRKEYCIPGGGRLSD